MKKTLKHKIFFGYLILVMIIFLVSFWSIYNFINLSGAINDIMVENYLSVVASEKMIEALERQDSAELMYLSGKKTEAIEIFKTNEREYLKWLARAEDNITIKEETRHINSINELYVGYIHAFSLLENKYEREGQNKAFSFYMEEIIPLFEEIKGTTRNLLMVNQQAMLDAQKAANKSGRDAIYSTLFISIIALVTGLLFAYYISNIIIKPTKRLTAAVKEIGQGNMEHEIKIKSSDEIGELAAEFNRMTRRLKEYEELNISKLVKEKNKSEAIVKSISSPVIVTDKENKIVLLNSIAEEVFGVDENEVIGNHFLEDIKNEQIFDYINSVISGKPLENGRAEKKIIKLRVEEKERYYQLAVTPVHNQKGEAELVVTLLDDITRLKEVDEMKSDFVSTVSHEFRSPLTSINMGIEILLEERLGNLNADQKEVLRAAREDSERLNNLVNDLLDLSRIESGKIQMDFRECFADQLIDSSTGPFIKQAADKGVKLEKDVEEGLSVWADFNKITWVLTNLVGNALRYTPSGGKITLGAEEKGSKIYFYVEDTGKGIPREFQEKIFEKFVRISDENSPAGSGSGLGLAISREIVEAHGGRIWVESEPGMGSKFIFTLKSRK